MLGFIRKILKKLLVWTVSVKEEDTIERKHRFSVADLLMQRHGGQFANPEMNVYPKIRFSLIHATNGKIIEYSIHDEKRDEWEHELFIVPEDKTISEALAMLMLLKGGK